MSEADFDHLLDALRTSVHPSRALLGEQVTFLYLSRTANHNQEVWPFISVSEGMVCDLRAARMVA
jgi:hypothetical protein